MPTDLHFICRQFEHWIKVGDNMFETGNRVVSEQVAKEVIGGRIYLHEKQSEPAWHGGTVTGWRHSPEPGRQIFRYTVDGLFRIRCPGKWGQEKAIIRR
jgi:hypothetical protein